MTVILVIPLSAWFCLGSFEFGRISWAAGQDGGTFKSMSTKPRCMTTSANLYRIYNWSWNGGNARICLQLRAFLWTFWICLRLASSLVGTLSHNGHGCRLFMPWVIKCVLILLNAFFILPQLKHIYPSSTSTIIPSLISCSESQGSKF